MITVEMTQYHLPEQCTTDFHKNKVFHARQDNATYASEKEALSKIAAMNRQCPCWQVAVTNVRPATREEMNNRACR